MGGVVQAVAKPFGLAKATPAGQVIDKEIDKRAEAKASRMDEEQGARMRGARRRGRQLLSDARLNPEAGVETLGSSQNL
jgi:hypothetical protein